MSTDDAPQGVLPQADERLVNNYELRRYFSALALVAGLAVIPRPSAIVSPEEDRAVGKIFSTKPFYLSPSTVARVEEAVLNESRYRLT